MDRIRKLSTFAMVLMAPMLIYYPYDTFAWLVNLAFLDPELWNTIDDWADRDAHIPMQTRLLFFTVWGVPSLMGVIGYLTSFSLLMLLRRGVVFDRRIALRLKIVGSMIFLSSTLSLLAGAVSPMIRSWHNADGPLPLRIWYNGGNVGLAFCGLGFLFLGLVLHEAIKIARENEEFI